jgi:glycogen debranching enzyme
VANRISITDGSHEPLGVTPLDVGVNVAVVSHNAERIDFCLFDERGETEIARLPLPTRIGDVHCGFITGIGAGARYGFRAEGPYAPDRGHRFDPSKLLVDPYARALDRPFAYRQELAASRPAAIDTAPWMPKGIVVPAGNAAPRSSPRLPGVIYEVAVKAFSKTNPAIPQKLRGTIAALAHPASIEHLIKLGVDTVELMPIVAWIDERHLLPLGLSNAWGYNPVAFMAPDPRLAPGGLDEIRNAVGALHGAGIGVIFDAVYNHTGESDALGPTLSLRGLDNVLYYRHAAENPGRLVNDAGTGNILAADRPEVVRLILDAMRHWATATGVDGFRLDLAAALGRSDEGFRRDAPLFSAIEADPVLNRLTMIAEPWDVGPGGYQLGNFRSHWREWNDRYRDDVRRFWRGDANTLGTLATRLAGSADIFAARRPSASVNFLAAHDGFPLADTVAYEGKHNQANGESNRDGSNANFSWNTGIEGATMRVEITEARQSDIRALLATLFVSRGTPMLTAGDEFARTQRGNNNAYAQDNSITWLDWDGADHALADFTRRLIALRKTHLSLSADSFLSGNPLDDSGIPDVAWLNAKGGAMIDADWKDDGRVVGMALYAPAVATAPADRTAIWINGSRATDVGWLPLPRALHAWTLLVNSARPDMPAASAHSSLILPARSVLVFAEVET